MKTIARRNSSPWLVIMCLAVAQTAWAKGQEVQVDVAVSNPYLLTSAKQKTYLKVGLTGFKKQSQVARIPVNVSIVLDRSGSMHGQKLYYAKEAAKMAIDRLNKNDIVSIVTYDDTVTVAVPATKVENRETIFAKINAIRSGGSTALFAGVSKGAEEVRKYKDKERVNRVILLSDGLANIGPSSPGALGDLGSALSKEGIAVTTIGLGLGYNEDLMVKLAIKSDGNHAFVEHPEELTKIFNAEFGDVLSVVAQDVEVQIKCRPGVKPLRILGRDGIIAGSEVTVRLNQLYSQQEKFVMLEFEPRFTAVATQATLASVSVGYNNMFTGRRAKRSGSAFAVYTQSKKKVETSVNKNVMADAVMLLAALKNKEAVALRDRGRKEEAKALLKQNAKFLREKAKELEAPELKVYSETNAADAKKMDDDDKWNAQRKQMRKGQSTIDAQMSY